MSLKKVPNRPLCVPSLYTSGTLSRRGGKNAKSGGRAVPEASSREATAPLVCDNGGALAGGGRHQTTSVRACTEQARSKTRAGPWHVR
eukprot:CAMPEP_0176193218 /NCGR_PEP_ID=MMETSP0121_2-20121125/5371_1 /TAXON_ID=160619 /ORGANISM="Kryptoperidinium foliaceum, Strain CCMP 1326" /LENGTH=87 /DNA_ID=CAMNT_0017531925 /DNA_START=87 /DNA_END=346 /DNA_ORIENTATION=+